MSLIGHSQTSIVIERVSLIIVKHTLVELNWNVRNVHVLLKRDVQGLSVRSKCITSHGAATSRRLVLQAGRAAMPA